jgi:hypothetical protein
MAAWAFPQDQAAQEVKHLAYELSFSEEDLTKTEFGDYEWLNLEGVGFEIAEGVPLLPFKCVRLALPINYEVSAWEIISSNKEDIRITGKIGPGIRPVPTSGMASDPELIEGPVYTRDAFYPGTMGRLVHQGSMSGCPVADFLVYPVQYNPVRQQIEFYREIRIEMTLTPMQEARYRIVTDPAKELNAFYHAVRSSVDNPEEVQNWENMEPDNRPLSQGPPVKYLIITTDEFAPAFQRLADWKTKKGVWTEIVTVEWIDLNITLPGDDPAKIRECIKDYKTQYGNDFEYVLLGGDPDYVPCRYAHVFFTYEGLTVPYSIARNIPSDLYYACLEGTWDGNNNGLYGELDDDKPHDPLDINEVLFVGRAPVHSVEEVDLFIDKVLLYEGEDSQGPYPTDYQKKLLFCAAEMDEHTHMGELKSQIAGDYVNFDGNPFFTIDYAYCRHRDYVKNLMDGGYNVINHAGHGWVNGIQTNPNLLDYYLRNKEIADLINSPRLTGVMYSTSCFSAAFDVPLPPYLNSNISFGECFVLLQNGGGAAYIGNSRYGWYYPNVSPNPSSWDTLSQWFDKAFFKSLYYGDPPYSYDQYHLGKAFAFGRNPTGCPHGTFYNNTYYRYCFYEQNLLGDPETPIYKNRYEEYGPEELELTCPATVNINPFGTQVSVTVQADGAPVDKALVCLWKNEEVYCLKKTGPTGEAHFNIVGIETTGDMFVTATKLDYVPGQSTIMVDEQLPLTSDKTMVSVFELTEVVNFLLHAGADNHDRPYHILGTMSGTSPGIPLPGGVTLPLNWDSFMEYTLYYYMLPMFIDFTGVLDANGEASAAFDTCGQFGDYLGETIHFAFILVDAYDYASNAVSVYMASVSQMGSGADTNYLN